MRILDFTDGFQSSTEPTSVPLSASQVSVTPSGNLSSTTAQTAVQELQGDIDAINAKVGVANGIAPTDADNKIPASFLPAVAIITVQTVENIAARDALTVQTGDLVQVTDAGGGVTQTYAKTDTGWLEIHSDAALAAHIANTSNPHNVTKSQVGLGNVDNTSDATKNAAAAVLTNKDIDGGTASNTSRFTLPKAAKTVLDALTRKAGSLWFDTTSGKPYYDDGSTLKLVGSGSGGSKNYIADGDAEAGNIGTSYADGSATPTANVTGTATATHTVSNSSPLSGSNSFLYTPGALGNGRAHSFTIDREDFAKPMEVEVSYEIGGTGYADGDMQIWIVAPSGAVIQPSSYKIMNASGPAKVKAVFQTESSGTSYKVKLHQTTATSTYTLKYEIKCGPQVTTTGSYIGPWRTDWTPTGSWTTNASYSGRWRQIGENAEYQVTVSLTGAPNASPLTVNVPHTFDTSKFSGSATTNFKKLGDGKLLDSGTADYFDVNVLYNSTTSVGVFIPNAAASTGVQLNTTVPFTWANGDKVDFSFTAPIQGWGATQVLSSESSEGRDVAVYTKGVVPTGTISTTFSIAKFGAIVKDTHGSYNTTTGQYLAPVSGWYDCACSIEMNHSSITSGTKIAAGIYVNGDFTHINSVTIDGTVAGTRSVPVSGAVYALAGQPIDFRVYSNGTGPTYGAVLSGSSFSIKLRSGNQQIAATETIACSYTTSTTTVNNTAPTVIFTVKDFDTHNAYNTTTGTFTAPAPGIYRVSAQIRKPLSTWTTGFAFVIAANKTGSEVRSKEIGSTRPPGGSTVAEAGGSTTFRLLTGDMLKISCYSDVAGVLDGSATANIVSIERIGI